MSIRVGFVHCTIAHRGMTPEETLEFARTHGMDGVQFLEPSVIDAGLDPERLGWFRRQADAMGLYLEVGLSSPNPVRRSREQGQPLAAGELASVLGRELEGVAALGCRHARVYVGDRHDRFRSDVSWSVQVEATR